MADLAAAREGLDAGPRQALRLRAALAAALAAEGDRRILWPPVFFGTGIAVYFTLTSEPPPWIGGAALIIAAVLTAALWRWPALRKASIVFAFIAAGFAVMQQAGSERGAPVLERRLAPVAVTGRVVDIDQLGQGWRVVVAPDPLPGIAPDSQPRRLRIRIPATSDTLRPGDRIAMRARLYPPPAQIVPGGWDLQRALYFAGIGGVGYSFGPARRIAKPDEDREGGWREWLLRLRNDMTGRITAALPGSTGGIAAALITGKRGAIAEEVNQAFRDSGLAHLLAISGMNLALVGGIVFLATRGGLALIPWLALRHPIKKIAAICAILVMFVYLMISGASVPTERSFIMSGIVFGAVLIDRLRISMRICAVAALVVLLIEPEGLIGVSFQMSFGAVVALIAAYETWGARFAPLFHSGSVVRKALGYLGAVVVTTLIATAGTEPFAIHHFHRIVLYSPLANVAADPLNAILIMPFGLVACLLMPFGLEWIGLVPMGWGIDATIWVAQAVAPLPGNVWRTPRLPMFGLAVIVLGGCWLCLWQGRWRRWGLVGIAAGLSTMLLTRPPDIVLGDFGRLLAARAASGDYHVADTAERLSRSFLAQETGAGLLPWPTAGSSAGALDCTVAERCTYSARGRLVALVTGAAGLPVVCDTVDAIVAQVPAGFACKSQIPVVDRIDSWRDGAIALWLDAGGVTVERANASRGDRPWVPHPVSARERAKRANGG
ncbi:MAG TPA: ComEC/Rec2 family competence protein [Stellaceae bacterium]|jgi:competence protein ComEC|nr:ComEC/Rec2 family competence protein [Stellaceae bacterium]